MFSTGLSLKGKMRIRTGKRVLHDIVEGQMEVGKIKLSKYTNVRRTSSNFIFSVLKSRNYNDEIKVSSAVNGSVEEKREI